MVHIQQTLKQSKSQSNTQYTHWNPVRQNKNLRDTTYMLWNPIRWNKNPGNMTYMQRNSLHRAPQRTFQVDTTCMIMHLCPNMFLLDTTYMFYRKS